MKRDAVISVQIVHGGLLSVTYWMGQWAESQQAFSPTTSVESAC